MRTKGTRSNPYSEEEYNGMREDGLWRGGWVNALDGLCYITASGQTERDDEDGLLGSRDNPFSEEAYMEIKDAGTWEGGYVNTWQGVVYITCKGEETDGCGSNDCGSGCVQEEGSSCGCLESIPLFEVREGDEVAERFAGADGEIVVGWTSGFSTRPPFSRPYAFIRFVSNEDMYHIVSDDFECRWTGTYAILVSGEAIYQYTPYYGAKPQTFRVRADFGVFTVPSDYFVDDNEQN